jgi:hypothetical protein
MTTYTVSSRARIGAPAAVAYGIIADYRDGHPHILPPKYFRNLRVEQGGVGAGTHIRFEMGMLGSWREGVASVAEPQPGRVIHERMPAQGIDTWFTVDPVGDGACDVTIATQLPERGGLAGGVERLVTTAFLRRVYRAELALLDEVSRRRA